MFVIHTDAEIYIKTIRAISASILCIVAFAKPYTILLPLDVYIITMLFVQMIYDITTVLLCVNDYHLESRRMDQSSEEMIQTWWDKHRRRFHIGLIVISVAAHIVSMIGAFYYYPLRTYTASQKDIYLQILVYIYIIITIVSYISFGVRLIAYFCDIRLFHSRVSVRHTNVVVTPVSSIVSQYHLNQEVLQTSEAPVQMTLSRTVEWIPVPSAVWNMLEECCICFDGKSGVTLRPCEHQNFCLNCVGHFGDCPLCRVEICGYRVLFYSRSAENSLNSSLTSTSDTSASTTVETPTTTLPNTPTD